MDHAPTAASEVDYRVTSLRPSWEHLPEHVRVDMGRVCGSEVVDAGLVVSSGFTGSYAGRLRLRDGRRVFAKASGPSMPHVLEALEREASVLAALPPGIPAPQLIGAGASQGWRLLVLEHIDGRMPGVPWSAREVEAAHDACLRLAVVATPAPETLGSRPLAEDFADESILAAADELAAGSAAIPDRMPSWLAARAADLCRLTHSATDLVAGTSLVHSDLRPDNLLIDREGTAWIVDWNWVTVGPAWADFVGLWPLMAWQGVDVRGWVTRSPLTCDADPEAIDAFLAAIAVYMVSGVDRPVPPGCTPALRQHQHLMARAFLGLLAQRRGWLA